MTEREYNKLRCRMWHLPRQIERARLRLRHLEAEAQRLGVRIPMETN